MSVAMFKKLKQSICCIKNIQGIEVIVLPDNCFSFNLISLNIEKNKVLIKDKYCDIQNFEELIKNINQEIPISLVINGKGILHRRIVGNEDIEDQEIIAGILPGASSSDFYIQKYLLDESMFISLIRRSIGDQIINRFLVENFKIINVAVGAFSVVDLFAVIGKTGGEFIVSGHNLKIENGILKEYLTGNFYENKDFKFDNDVVHEKLLLAFASAFQTLSYDSNICCLNIDQFAEVKSELEAGIFFKKSGLFILAFLFILLLVNYLCFSFFKKRNQELALKKFLYIGMLKEVDNLEKEVKEKKHFLQNAGWLTVPKTSYYADQIASTVPEKIKFQELNVNPLNERLTKRGNKFRFQADTIYISGTCNSPIELNPWIKNLKAMEWVSSIGNLNYLHDQKNNSGIFEVEIRVNDKF